LILFSETLLSNHFKASILVLIVFPLFGTADSKIGSKTGDKGQLKKRELISRKPVLALLKLDS
jgi:hypothetical protein